MATLDVDDLRDYLMDYTGTAAFSGFPAAMLDVMGIQNIDAHELRAQADGLGVDLSEFEAEKR